MKHQFYFSRKIYIQIYYLALFILLMGMRCTSNQIDGVFQIVDTPPTSSKNDYYQGNRPPLKANPLIKLPIGHIQAEGWLRHQLELMADGFTGHLGEISKFCKIEGNAWVDPQGRGENGWEEVPYWLKGFISLGYNLDDKRIIQEAQRWVDGVLGSQDEKGYFGPRSNWEQAAVHHTTANDIWPNMIMLYVLRTHYEFTADPRVIPFMTKYFRWLVDVPDENFLIGAWQKKRAGDNLQSIHWLYNQTGEEWLLDLARRNHEHTSDWVNGIPTKHGVNLAQAFREPAQYYQQSHDMKHLKSTVRNYDSIMSDYGQVPGGIFGADEHVRPDFTGPRQGAETCSMVEFMYSHEVLMGITGNPEWADRCEAIAFNSLPAAMTADLKGLHYLTAPNLVQLDHSEKYPLLDNKGVLLPYDPWDYRCCKHNVGFGWPYYAEHLWMATAGNGLAAVSYSASTVKAKVGNGTEIQIKEITDYPFGEVVEFKLSMDKSDNFPLFFRVPVWAEGAQVNINGNKIPLKISTSSWISLDRHWQNGDIIHLEFPMSIRVKKPETNKNFVFIARGPLIYSLKIGEKWENFNGWDKRYRTDNWPAFEVYPTTPWNYGLVIDANHPEKSIEVLQKNGPLASQPFTVKDSPIELRVKGKRIPNWKLEPNGLIGAVPESPVRSEQQVETITLIPMGCARLRVSAFPTVE